MTECEGVERAKTWGKTRRGGGDSGDGGEGKGIVLNGNANAFINGT